VKCFLPGVTGLVEVAGGGVGLAGAEERVGLEEGVGEEEGKVFLFAVEIEGAVEVCVDKVEPGEIADGQGFAAPVIQLPVDREGLMSIGEGLSQVSQALLEHPPVQQRCRAGPTRVFAVEQVKGLGEEGDAVLVIPGLALDRAVVDQGPALAGGVDDRAVDLERPQAAVFCFVEAAHPPVDAAESRQHQGLGGLVAGGPRGHDGELLYGEEVVELLADDTELLLDRGELPHAAVKAGSGRVTPVSVQPRGAEWPQQPTTATIPGRWTSHGHPRSSTRREPTVKRAHPHGCMVPWPAVPSCFTRSTRSPQTGHGPPG
jgi:hypothetical protein